MCNINFYEQSKFLTMTKNILSVIFFMALFPSVQAQDVVFRLNNYKLNKNVKLENVIHGAEIGYIQHMTKFLDLYVPLRLGPRGDVETKRNSVITKTTQVGNFGLDVALQAKYDNGRQRLVPFISAGLGTDIYDEGLAFGAPVGVGLNVRINSKTFITVANYYRFGMTNETPKSWMHSLGVSVDLSKVQSKFTPPPISKEQEYQARQLATAKMRADAKERAKLEEEAAAQAILQAEAKAKADALLAEAEKRAKAEERAKTEEQSKPIVVSEEVKKVLDYALKSVEFELGSALLTTNSYSSLDAVATTLTANPELNIRIEGHTDRVGNDAINLKLSETRANTCMSYLISKGISANRLKIVGYGAARPVADNETEDGRRQNRRVEFIPFK